MKIAWKKKRLGITIKRTEFYDAVEFLSRFWLSKETLMGLNRKNGPIVTLRNKYSCITRKALTLGGFTIFFAARCFQRDGWKRFVFFNIPDGPIGSRVLKK